jgi:uncharacterized damage-inducible protein DinB
MTTLSDLTSHYDYGYWANRRLFAVLAQLTPAQFLQPVAGSYGSIRNTLVHTMSAEWGWLERCGGHPRGAKLNPDDYPTLQSLVDQWTSVERWMRDFFATLADADLARTIEFALPGGEPHMVPLGNLMLHSALHAVHHRGQVALLLRELGVAPGNFDRLIYDIEK